MKLENSKLKNKEVNVDSKLLRSYIDKVGYNESPILKELRIETSSLGDISIMQIGAVQGALIKMLCSIAKFKRCIEIGVFTGYSSICIAEGMPADGKLYALDTSVEFTEIAKKYWKKSCVENKIELIIDKAINTLNDFLEKELNNTFDFIFIDADKKNIMDYYEISLDLLRQGGMILIDNTIWKGRVLDLQDNNASTISIQKLNEHIANDQRVDHCLIAIYDGMTLCMKK